MHSPGSRSKALLFASSIPMMVVAAVLVSATLFTFLQTDDFCTFGRLFGHATVNPFSEAYFLYQNWTGRYSSSLLIAIIGWLSGTFPLPITYSASLLVFVLLFWVATLQATRVSAPGGRVNALLALVIFASTLLLIPSKLEQFLWLTGAAVYFVGASILLLIMHQLVAVQSAQKPSMAKESWLAFLVVLAVGFNEFIAIVVGAFLLWSAMQALLTGTRPKAAILCIFIFAAAFAISILAPGNYLRDSASSLPRHDLVASLNLASTSAIGFFGAMMQGNLLPIAGSLLGAAFAGSLAARVTQKPGRYWLPYTIALIGAFPMHLVVYSFLTGEVAPGRIINQAFMLMYVGLCLLAAWLGQSVRNRVPENRRWVMATGLAISGLVVVGSENFRDFSSVVFDYAPTWHAEQLERHQALVRLKGSQDAVYVRPFSVEREGPPLFQGGDVGPSSKYWVNQCVADYYDVQSVILMRRLSTDR